MTRRVYPETPEERRAIYEEMVKAGKAPKSLFAAMTPAERKAFYERMADVPEVVGVSLYETDNCTSGVENDK